MVEKDQDAALREAARARGFRLVKSRRRKPGGDFGRYGLVGLDSGRECLGFGADGLTATIEEVHAYLRGGEVASWKRSLIGVVGEGEPAPAEKKAARTAEAPVRRRRGPEASPKTTEAGERTTPSPSAKPPMRAAQVAEPEPDPPPAPAGGAGAGSSSASSRSPKPIAIREATRRDAAGLAKLLGIPAPALAERLGAAVKAGEAPFVALRGDRPVGVVAWTILATLHQGPRGRITLLSVAEGERRQGLGTALLAAVEQRLTDEGIAALELLLDIDFDAPTAFLRRAGWTRTTNGYGKEGG